MIGIYMILNTQNYSVYVGQSVTVEKRLSQHKSNLKNNRHENSHIQRSYDKYGLENFLFEILEECTLENIDERERFWISEFNSTDREFGYNRDSGGNLNHNHSLETREKMSESKRGKFVGKDSPFWIEVTESMKFDVQNGIGLNEFKKVYNLGHRVWERARNEMGIKGLVNHSEESKQKMSDSKKGKIPWNKGKPHSEETRKKISEANKNPSEETRRKISEANKNPSEETRKKISEANSNPSEETRRKISESRKGKRHTKESIIKMSEVHSGENNHMFGKHHSESTKVKISQANKNPSEETRKKMSEANKGKIPHNRIQETPEMISDVKSGIKLSEFMEKYGIGHSVFTRIRKQLKDAI